MHCNNNIRLWLRDLRILLPTWMLCVIVNELSVISVSGGCKCYPPDFVWPGYCDAAFDLFHVPIEVGGTLLLLGMYRIHSVFLNKNYAEIGCHGSNQSVQRFFFQHSTKTLTNLVIMITNQWAAPPPSQDTPWGEVSISDKHGNERQLLTTSISSVYRYLQRTRIRT